MINKNMKVGDRFTDGNFEFEVTKVVEGLGYESKRLGEVANRHEVELKVDEPKVVQPVDNKPTNEAISKPKTTTTTKKAPAKKPAPRKTTTKK